MSKPSALFIILCFVVIVIFWVVTAFFTKRTTKNGGGWILRIVFYTIIILTIYFQSNIDFLSINLWPKNLPIRIVADIITALGLITMIWARVVLGRNWSANIVLKEDHKLITAGPYAFVRHPIYTGLILMVLGVVIYVNTLALAIFFIIFSFGAYYKAKKEEKFLLTYFPEAYPEYKKKVKALIPFVF